MLIASINFFSKISFKHVCRYKYIYGIVHRVDIEEFLYEVMSHEAIMRERYREMEAGIEREDYDPMKNIETPLITPEKSEPEYGGIKILEN